MLRVEVPSAEAEFAADLLWQAGANGVEERVGAATTALLCDADPVVAAALLDPAWAWEEVGEPDGWEDAWRAHIHTQRIAPHSRRVIQPAWAAPLPIDEKRPDDQVVVLAPGRAFGSGTHPTTRLCLLALEDVVRPGDCVLDVGCGSGVLSIASALLGASTVTATDIDPEALAASTTNARANGVSGRITTVVAPGGAYDVIVANILAPVLLDLATDVLAALRPGGALILSGLLEDRWDHVAAAFALIGSPRITTEGGWVALRWTLPGW